MLSTCDHLNKIKIWIYLTNGVYSNSRLLRFQRQRRMVMLNVTLLVLTYSPATSLKKLFLILTIVMYVITDNYFWFLVFLVKSPHLRFIGFAFVYLGFRFLTSTVPNIGCLIFLKMDMYDVCVLNNSLWLLLQPVHLNCK